ncbi:hypothetical protein L596_013728 [Steinernema carpocapsae]|uniref:ABC-type xenobiotic transporter n=2 Tax=Steinernema carpocapsae TaxID=34508 RepID=A0A4U5P1R0_STECR|nr:hypothetical protein L596_013728 [Steinernema carpocapsae]
MEANMDRLNVRETFQTFAFSVTRGSAYDRPVLLGDAHSEMSEGDALFDFCGFVRNGSSFRTRYILDEAKLTLTPCAESALMLGQHLPLLFFTIVNLVSVSHLRRIPTLTVNYLIWLRISIAVLTCLLIFFSAFLSFISSLYSLKSVIIIQYGLIVFIWAIYCGFLLTSLYYTSWPRNKEIVISVMIASKCFILLTVTRWIPLGFSDPRTYIVFFLAIFHIFGSIANIVEWRIAKNLPTLTQLVGADEEQMLANTDESVGFLSRMFFCWVNPLIKKGYSGQLQRVDDLFQLPPSLKISHIQEVFEENSPSQFTDAENFSLAKSLWRSFGIVYMAVGLGKLFGDVLSFAGPILLHFLVTWLEVKTALPLDSKNTHEGLELSYGYLYAFCMFAASFLSAVSSINYNFYVNKVSLRIRAATVTALYDHITRVPMHKLSGFSSGEIINFMSTDIDRIVNFCNSFHAFWSLPMQLAIALFLLHREVGTAFLSGLIAAILMVPLNKYITIKIGQMSTKMMECKDKRMQLISETMRGIRSVKLCNWEDYFEKRISDLRQKELKYLKARKYLDALCVYLWASAPVLITIAIVTTYTVWLQEHLTAAKVFTSLALVNILIMPLNAFPWVLNGLVESWVSLKRLNRFFELKTIDLHEYYKQILDEKQKMASKNATFSWDGETPVVSDISFEGKESSIIAVVGPVGCGKTTLLEGLLGETLSNGRKVEIHQSSINQGIAYVSQDCWLRRGTVMENILCGSSYQHHFYKKCIEATALESDIKNMPGGDQYVIGDEGSTLSGGQRARLALARAAYQDNDVYLLDDPLASVDCHVGEHIWDQCIENLLKKRGKLVIIATHYVRYLKNVDEIIVLGADGRIRKQGPPAEILPEIQNISEDTPKYGLQELTTSSSSDSLESAERIIPQSEQKEVGTVKIGVYGSYIRATGYFLFGSILVAIVAMQASKNFSDFWLSKWTEKSKNDSQPHHDLQYPFNKRPIYAIKEDESWNQTIFYLTVYGCLAGANTIFTLIRAFLFAYGGVVSAKNLHKNVLRKVLRASLAWWDSTPAGRVTNRLCADVYTVDDSLPFQLNICLASFFNLMGALILMFFALPTLIPFVVVIGIVYYALQRYYRFTTCEVKRLTTVSLSPLYSHISDTVNGLSTIRAHRFVERFYEMLKDRLTDNIRAQYAALASGQWLSVRLQMMGVLMVTVIAFTAVIQSEFLQVDSGMVALAITYALTMTGLLNSLLSSFIDSEKELVSVERIADYIENIEDEEDNAAGRDFSESLRGEISFNCVSLRYGLGLPLALENLSLNIGAGQRVGIVGRTGAGKSSILQALLRAHPIESGRIFIDGVDSASINLRSLRSQFAVVTQRPFVFSGTLRDNFTVGGIVSDADILAIVQRVGFSDFVTKAGGLDGEIKESGSNFSSGEKQILSICRLILSKPKIVLIDEATAHMDDKTHSTMMEVIHERLPNTTVISIMHRLHGLENFDLIVQMNNGKVAQQGPATLFLNEASD